MSDTLILPRFSHSQLTLYMDCGEKYRLERRHRMGGSASWALVGGKAFHTWTEVYDKGVPIDPAYFLTIMDREVRETLASDRNSAIIEGDIRPTGYKSKDWPNKRDRSWWEHHGPIFCQQYIDWRASEDNELMPAQSVDGLEFHTEMKAEGTLGGLEVLGFVDRLITDSPFGKPVILDLKTGKEPGTLLQLATYAVLMSEQMGIEIKHGAFYLAEKGELSRIHDLSRFTREYIESLYEQAARGVAAGVFLPNPNSFCNSCPVRQNCGLYGGALPPSVPLLEPQFPPEVPLEGDV